MNKQAQGRIQELESYHIFEADLSDELDGLTNIASKICGTPISLINLLNDKLQVTKSGKGWNPESISKTASFCQYTIQDSDMMIIEDARKDQRFSENPVVKDDPNIRFYAGMPLQTSNGYNLGAICVIDDEPRQLTDAQKESLKLLADEVVARFELVKKKHKLEQRNKELEDSNVFLRNSSDTQAIIDPETHEFIDINNEAFSLLGGHRDDFVGKTFGDRIADEEIRTDIINFLNQRSNKKAKFEAPVETDSGEILYLEHIFSWHKGYWYMTARDITDRAKAKHELEKRSQAIEASIDGIAILDEKYNFTFVNDAHANIFGYDPEELEGERWEMLYDYEQRKKFKKYTRRNLEREQQWRGEAEGITKNGQHIDLEISLSKQANGSVICVARNISGRLEIQKKLKSTLTNLAIGQELAEVGSWTWNIKNHDIKWSEKVYDICGIKNVSLKPTIELFQQRVHPDDREEFADVIERVQRGESINRYEHRLLMPDGEVKWVRHSGRTTYNSSGKAAEVNGAVQDITNQKRAQLKLQREKELSDKIINSLPISFFMFDRGGNAIRWNDKVREITGYSEQQIAYMHPRDFFPPQHQKRIKQSIANVFAHGESTVEADLQNKDGETAPHIFSATRFESHYEDYFLGTGIDISDLKEYENRLENSLEEKEVLLSEIHHRVKNNLAIISGLLELEGFNTSDQQTKNILQNSQMRIHSMAQVHEMLYNSEDFSKLSFQSFVAKIIESIKGVYQKQKDINFDLDIEDVQLNVNQAIPCGLIINEIVTNAYKHAFENTDGGTIQVTIQKAGDTVELTVKDNGSGLPDDFSLSKSSTLGFTLIDTLTNQLKGDISINSSGGTEVVLTFTKENIKGTGSTLNLDQSSD